VRTRHSWATGVADVAVGSAVRRALENTFQRGRQVWSPRRNAISAASTACKQHEVLESQREFYSGEGKSRSGGEDKGMDTGRWS